MKKLMKSYKSSIINAFSHTIKVCTISIAGLIILFNAISISASEKLEVDTDKTQWVDTFIGTGGDGHTFPGAVVPFGMVQLSPDTAAVNRGIDPQAEIYKHSAGYHYDDTSITGFSHTHFSGTGHSDLGDLLIMPFTGKAHLDVGTVENPDSGYRSRFSHNNEQSKPGYYFVELEDYNITAELSATQRAGFHKYTFKNNQPGQVMLDLTSSIYNFSNKVIWSDVRVIDKQTLLAYRSTNGWAKQREMYFAIKFSRPFDSIDLINLDNNRYRCHGCLDHKNSNNKTKPSTIVNSAIQFTAGKAIKVMAHYNNPNEAPLMIKVGLSAVSRSNALENLNTEINHWDFELTKKQAQKQWQKQLSVIDAKGSKSQKRQLYTALYHTLQAPSIYQDVNGQYRGVDGEIHQSADFTNYTLFSLWDTYRALHPLLTYIAPDKVPDMIQSMLAHYQQSYDNILPIWSFQAHETWTMIGYHAVSVIADAYLKGITNFDTELAMKAMLDTANHASYDAISDYKKYGFVPMDKLSESVSITLEYAYNDFTIAKMADAMGNQDVAKTFYQRASSYKNLFDHDVKFMRGKTSKGVWDPDFDPEDAKLMGPFTEGNSFQYTFYVPHDVTGLISLIGGDKAFENRLDTLFNKELSHEKIKEHEDIAGLIGQYAHGNEPSHHIAYLYNYAGKPWRTQERIRQIMDTLSSDKPDGLAGNDDVGQMSAWYIFSAMGFYPVSPADLTYAIGAPQLPYIALKLSNGNVFTVKASGLSIKNKYIKTALLNGKPLKRSYITHNDIINGGELKINMSDKPNKSWANKMYDRPPSMNMN
ncbi:GH92 family glycosyl hydrolase [Pseudoalteromonas denitrificans]|uniref:Alpha-1,2-mannosidase, putative n=1 Tax=Pseudoalteromonas denitrificans DSM 6059 TaxID=1123010 RepID=A0A1I1RIL2_9GAMM|nr:GH92 family glycosyl hydrolase [Pseudoalteromonas denitrificans]SFD34129.1 alpha-1,2-mannosidase, putative [Pseudoalteromonas denitrificans DSM 6059]